MNELEGSVKDKFNEAICAEGMAKKMRDRIYSSLLCIGTLVMILALSACRYESPVQFRPMPEVLPEMPPIRVMATNLNTMAIGIDGSLWGFGANGTGQMGDGTTLNWSFFDQVGTEMDWVSVDTGRNHTVAVKADGTLWAWGWYERTWRTGLGDGTTTGSNIPIQIGIDTDWVMVAAGTMHTAAIKADGSLWAWGNNADGRLGNGEIGNDFLSPIRIGTDKDWAYVVADSRRTFAIKVDGSLWGWGDNERGQLGDGTTTSRAYPVRIGADATWVSVSTDVLHTVAIKSDGSLWAWGRGYITRTGIEDVTHWHSPFRIGTDTDWVSAAAGAAYTVAVKEDGSLWVSGRNDQLRFGPYDRDPTVFTQIAGTEDEHWVNVVAGDNRVFAITKDGRIRRLGGRI